MNTEKKVIVGVGSCGLASGAKAVYDIIAKGAEETGYTVIPTGCIGMCYSEVLVDIFDGSSHVTYGNIRPEDAEILVSEHLKNGNAVEKLIVRKDSGDTAEESFFSKQHRIVLRNAGRIDPCSIDAYIDNNGYKSLEKALKTMSGDDVISEIKESGLRGRGGAGFSTGMKWKFAKDAPGSIKYIICNGDEGDPGAFMDRSVLEGDPHSVLEGMAIAGFAIGASKGIAYIRAEYPLAVKNFRKAINDAVARNFLGEHILGTDFSFFVEVKEGAGAFVCGEETALIASVEGQRGMPRLRPPFPAQSGVFGHPTNINNVETFANVPWIILNGSKSYSAIGTEKSKGTKVFALAGKIKRGGLVEVPMGMPLREIIYEIGGGTSSGLPFKAVQLGGPSGGCIPAELIDTPVDYDSLNATGAIMGSGGMIVMDSSSCMVDIARFFLNFTQEESCGKCTFCRIGTKRMLEILTRITKGEGKPEDIEKLEYLAENIRKSSLCGLGQTAPNPVLTTLKYFKHEYLAHINDKKCPAGKCTALISYSITDACVGCGACIKACPADAITGEKKKLHSINPDKCVKCGQCLNACKFKAVKVS